MRHRTCCRGTLFPILLILALALPALAGPRAMAVYSLDTRDYNSLSLYMMSDRLPLDLDFWGLTDLHGEQGNAAERRNLVRSFSEYRLTWAGASGGLFGVKSLGIQGELNDMTPARPAVVRVGLSWTPTVTPPTIGPFGGMPWRLNWRVHPWESDDEGWQASLNYLLPLSPGLWITGFLDRDAHPDGDARWVFEPQLNVRIHERTWFVVEYRYNGYEDAAPGLDGTGWSAGLRIDL